ncbi:MAG: efflux RND transporter periplasmic adaptor subunit [Rhizobiales bacterium]|nr:efflux RND transporter periplasmic adaptor subunit [Hyphomicrobiales bacterium]
MVKRLVIALVVILVAAICGGLVWFNFFRDQMIADFFANMPVAPATVSTVTVEPAAWTPAIDTIGTVNAAQGVDLTVQTSGVVEKILFTANQRVEQGSSLVQLDDAIEAADLEAAKTQAALDQQSLQRAIELSKKGVGTTANLDAAQAAASASAAQVDKLVALLRQKTLRAPFTGTIGIPRIDIGQYLTPGTIVATLQDIDTLRADFSIPEQRMAELRIGQAVRFGVTSDSLPFDGKITGIDPKVDASSRLVAVRAEIENPDGKLTPGQFVQVQVELPVEEGVITIPQTALVTSLYGDYVYVVRPAKPAPAATEPATPPAATDGEAAAAPAPAEATPPAAPSLVVNQIFVKVGRRAEGRVEIREGLAPGDQVVTAGQNRLFNGMPVTIDNTIDPSAPRTQTQASAQ